MPITSETIKVGKDSMMVSTKVLLEDVTGTMAYGIWIPPYSYTPQAGDTIHTVSDADAGRPDLIAWKYYRNVKLFWLIMWVNNIRHPLRGLVTGKKLIIPSPSSVRTYVSSRK